MLPAPNQSNQRTSQRFLIALDTAEQARAIQTFLWCLWLTALNQCRALSTDTCAGTSLTQTFGFESIGNLKTRTLNGGGRNEVESFGYDALDRLIQSSGTGIAANDTGSFGYDSAGNLTSKAGLTLGYAPTSLTSNNRLCGIAVVNSSTCGTGSAAVNYDGNGNILAYTRPTAAQSNAPSADGALLQLSGYTAFNLPTSITKTLGGSITASSEFFYDAGYQRVRQVKRSGAVQTGAFADDILYVVPGGFEVHRNAAGQVTQSIATVSGMDGVVATVTTNFDANTGLAVVDAGQAANTTALSGTNTITKLLLKDHLGSMVAEFIITSATTGTLVVHGFGPWGNARNAASPLADGQRGFTGHEHLAELGIIHMNGRLYDAVLGRFLQADPIIQAPHNAQSHNRYSYVLNNPLSFTDPSGFSFWTKWRTTVVAIAASIVTAGAASAFVSAYMYAGLLGDVVGAAMQATIATTSNFVGAVAGGFAAGGISGGNIQSALQGAFTAALTSGVGEFSGAHSGGAMSLGQRAGQVAGHAAVGCGSAAMAGGSCRAGAMSAGFSAFAGHVPVLSNTGLIGRAVVGAIASKLSGGKAENGALSAAFQYLFNDVATAPRPRGGGKLGIITALLTAGAAVINSQSSSSSGEDSQKEKTFVTYTLDGPSGEVYGGRTSGYGTPDEVVNQRFKYHHMRLLGYGNPTVDRSASGDDGAAAIRGREQDIIDGHGGVGSPYVGNSINGISIINPFRPIYLGASLQRFGVYVPGQ